MGTDFNHSRILFSRFGGFVWTSMRSFADRLRRPRNMTVEPRSEDDRTLSSLDADFITPAGWSSVPETVLIASQPSVFSRKR